MRALSIRQPYAEWILNGQKREESRSIPTNIRGRVYIYAGLKPAEGFDKDDIELGYLPAGVIVGTVACVDLEVHCTN